MRRRGENATLLEAKVSGMGVVPRNTAVNGWRSEEHHIGTEIVSATLAEITSAAGHTGFDGDTIT